MKTTKPTPTNETTFTARLCEAELAGDLELLRNLVKEARALKLPRIARKTEVLIERIHKDEVEKAERAQRIAWDALTPAERLDALRNLLDGRVDWMSFRSAEKTRAEMLKTFVDYATKYGLGDAIRNKGCEMFEFEAIQRAKNWIREAIRGIDGQPPTSVADLRERLVKLKDGATRRCIEIARESRGDRAGFEAIKDAAEAGAMARIPERIDGLLESVDSFVAGKFCDPTMASTSAAFEADARREYEKAIVAGVVDGRNRVCLGNGEAK